MESVLLQERVLPEHVRLRESDVCSGTQTHIVVHHQDWELGIMGVWEQDRALVEEVVLHEVRARLREKTRGIVMERDDQLVHARTKSAQLGV